MCSNFIAAYLFLRKRKLTKLTECNSYDYSKVGVKKFTEYFQSVYHQSIKYPQNSYKKLPYIFGKE